MAQYEQALLLFHHVGDRFGEVLTRYSIAMVSKALERVRALLSGQSGA